MNLVLDEAEEISVKKKTRKPLGTVSTSLMADGMLALYHETLVVSFRADSIEGG